MRHHRIVGLGVATVTLSLQMSVPLPMAETLAALLWDVDGTLAATEEYGHRPAFNDAFRDAGLPWRWDSTTYRRLLAVSGGRERLARYLADVEGCEPHPERLDALVRSKQAHYARRLAGGTVPLRGGVRRLLQEAAAAGLPQGIVTTSARAAVQALCDAVLGADLAAVFSFWVCGEDVQRKKPDPEAYRLGAAQLGLPGRRILAIEDSPLGLRAAVAAGLPCLVTLEPGRLPGAPDSSAARAVVDGLGDGERPVRVFRGPPCPAGQVTLSWLQCLLDEA
jgi:HAD superfamily hydrolase (TIGR01509 family)